MAGRRKDVAASYGVSACRALFLRRPQDIVRVFIAEERIPAFGDLLAACARRRLPYKVVPPAELEAVTESRHHEGICIVARRRRVARFVDLVRAPGRAVVVGIAGVGNPHNVGAIMRTAAHFGARGFVFLEGGEGAIEPDDAEGAGEDAPLLRLSAAAARTSEGAAEWLEIAVERDVARTLRAARAAGFAVAATSSHGERYAARSLYEAPLPARLLLLLGGEGEGLPAELLSAADRVLAIPGTGQVESLNVAAAAAVLLAEHWRGGMRRK